MKIKILPIFFFISSFSFIFALQAQTFELKQNHPDGLYKSGEKIRFTLIVSPNTNDSIFLKVKKNNNQTILKKAIFPEKDTMLVFETSFHKPCAVFIDAKIKDTRKSIGAIVDPEKIKPGLKSPRDLSEYWKKEKQTLEELPMEVNFGKDLSKTYEHVCFDTEINCTGPKPVHGYFARPTKAAKGSLPAVILLHAAGVKGSWCRSEADNALKMARMGKGALCFDLNAHGMLNGQPDEYYSKLEEGELKDYYIQGLESRDDFYFKGMYLRLIRTIDFLTKMPEWDGKRVLVIGESQGGGQALAAAGLDSRVSAVVATVPAMCDWGGTLDDRKGGWPQPFERPGNIKKIKKAIPYFDTANLLKNSKAQIVVEIGLIDNTCPATSIYAAINQAKGEKTIYPVTYRDHGWPNQEQRQLDWDKNVNGKKDAFIEEFLK